MKSFLTSILSTKSRYLSGILPLLLLLASAGTVKALPTYTGPQYYYGGAYPSYGASCSYGYYVNSFSITGASSTGFTDGSITCPSSSSSAGYNGYFDRTAIDSVTLQQGGTYSATVTMTYSLVSGSVYIDFNDDGTFDQTEQVIASPIIGTTSVSVLIPLTAPVGRHQMRIFSVYDLDNTSSAHALDPSTSSYSGTIGGVYYFYYQGATRDYIANITAAPVCSGTPSVTTTPSGTLGVCSGGKLSFTASAGIFSGMYYQWQEQISGVWTNISGATTNAYTTPGITATRYFRVADSCSGSGSVGYSATITVSPSAPAYATLPYVQGFESWQNYCDNKDVPDGHWKNTPSSGSNSWRRNDQGALAGWTYPTNYGYAYLYNSPNPPYVQSGSYSARFHSSGDYSSYGYAPSSYLGTPSTYIGDLDMYIDCSGSTGNKLLQFYWENPVYSSTSNSNDSLRVLYSTTGPSGTFTQIWTGGIAQFFTQVRLEIPTNSATTIIRFEGIRDIAPGATYNYEYSDLLLDSVYVGPACSATPSLTGIAPSGNVTGVCPGATYTLKPTGLPIVGGLTYQWQSSTVPFTTYGNVPAGAGGTNQSITTPPVFDSVAYRVTVTCPYTTPSSSATSLSTYFYIANKPKYAAINLAAPAGPGYHYSFENWGSRCSTSDAPLPGSSSSVSESNWANYPSTGDNSWRREDQGSTANWYYYGYYYYSAPYFASTRSQDSTHSARFYSYYRNSGYNTPGNMYLFLDCSTITGTKELQYYINTAVGSYNPDTLKVDYSTDNGVTYTNLNSVFSTGGKWKFYKHNVPSNSAKTIIRFQGKYGQNDYDYGPGIGLDNVVVVPPCSGKPTAGSIPLDTPCANKDFTWAVVGTSKAAGLHYQWQSSATGSASSWSDVAGDSAASVNLNIATGTYFRVIVTCTNSGLSDTTAAVYFPVKAFYYCYCKVTNPNPYNYYFYAGIGNLSIIRVPSGDSVLNNGSPVPTFNNPRVYALYTNIATTFGYTNYDAVTTKTMYLDSLYRIYGTQVAANSYLYNSYPIEVYIDFNHSASFEASELVLNKIPGATSPSNTVTDTFRIPHTALIGTTGMRALIQQYASTPYDPCGGGSYYPGGEIQDYLININYRPCNGFVNAGTATTTDSILCEGYDFTLTDTTHETQQSGITWFWQQSHDGHTWTSLSGTTNKDTLTRTFTFATMGDTSWFRQAVLCSSANDTSYSNTVQVHKGPAYACYCYSMATGGRTADSSDIGAFTIGGFVVNKRGPHVLNPAATAGHTNYTGTIIDLDVDSTYAVGLYHILRSAKHGDAKVTMFIDYNNDFSYNVPEERVWTAYTSATSWFITTTLTIPNSVVSDVKTGMRLIINNNVAANVPSDNACGGYTSGETQDYVVRFNRKWATGVGSINNLQNLAMYPNPTTGKFSVKFSASQIVKDLQINVTNMTGQQVLHNSYQNANGQFSADLDLTAQPRGLYFVEFMADGERMIRKLVVK
ncbi:MAG: T9SS type A sorting domain-containing protein [Taibaiella sp.]|nr:T9SS type A sorting domain-containing protein [Taibaiella sp.]